MKTFFVIVIAVLSCTSRVFAAGTIENLGNLTQVLVPGYALGMAVQEDGYDATKDFIAQFATMELVVNGLKLTIHEQRPDASDHMSFPSGHTASAFSGAAFIHKRYGIKRAIIPYLGAGFTGFSRIHAKRHHWHDVLAGALIGELIGWYMTSRKSDKTEAGISVSPDGVTLNFKTVF